MKKLKAWQIVLLIVFYPVGIVYFIVWLCRRKKRAAPVNKFDLSKAEIERDFHTKVVGVTFKNSDGSSRQEIIKKCRSGEELYLKPTPSKEFPDAIGVFTGSGKQIGNVNASLADDLKEKYPTNPMSCAVSDIHGGEDGKYLGVNLHLIIYKRQ